MWREKECEREKGVKVSVSFLDQNNWMINLPSTKMEQNQEHIELEMSM